MKRHLNTLFVTTQGAYLAKEGETVVVKVENETRMRLPILSLSGIVCFGQVSMSPFLMGFCGERGVCVSFLSERGRFLARVVGPTTGNVLLRRAQYRQADDEIASLKIVRPIVAAKIANSRAVLLRSLRDHPDTSEVHSIEASVSKLAVLLAQLEQATSVDGCRGIEGAAASTYFAVFNHLLTQQKDAFCFRDRSRRPPLDNVNALLSFVYTLLVHDVSGALESVGLDPAVGFLHRDRPGRPSLALDLMEEFRPWFADRLVVSLINLKQMSATDFKQTDSGAVQMTEEGRKTVLVTYQKRKQDEMVHPFLGEKTTVGLMPHLQALILARYLRGELDGYPPLVWK
jgi:CRISPR-associated protein Cas1